MSVSTAVPNKMDAGAQILLWRRGVGVLHGKYTPRASGKLL
jgi:hypothetical protein